MTNRERFRCFYWIFLSFFSDFLHYFLRFLNNSCEKNQVIKAGKNAKNQERFSVPMRSRYSVGVSPKCFLNALKKYSYSLKPDMSATFLRV